MTYRVVNLHKYSVITRNNSICLDRELKKRNYFLNESEAQEFCNELNKPEQEIKLIICDAEKLKIK